MACVIISPKLSNNESSCQGHSHMNAPDELFKAPASNLSVEFPPDKQDERNSWDTELVAMCPLHAKRHWDGRVKWIVSAFHTWTKRLWGH